MDWSRFNTHGESPDHAFEVMCNIIFESWCKEEYGDHLVHFCFVNGNGGDGGVEAYGVLDDSKIIAVQSKWFRNKLTETQIKEISSSFKMAVEVRPQIGKYIVCIPRDLGSSRRVKNKEIARKTEESKWLAFVEECKTLAPDVELELWTETYLQEKLTHDDLRGVHKFWFENSELLDSQFELSLEKAQNSWAKTSYIPDIYTEGVIHDKLCSFVGSYDQTKKRYEQLCTLLDKMSSLKRAYEELLLLDLFCSEKELEEKIKSDLANLQKWIVFLNKEKDSVQYGNVVNITENFHLSCTVQVLKESLLMHRKYFHFHDAETVLDKIYDDYNTFLNLFERTYDNRVLFLGNPGSGKTTAIVAEASAMLRNHSHLPILVRAREFNTGDTWCSIIEKTLGLSSNWDEAELFRVLENAALIRNKNNSSAYGIVPKCIICIDGIDEAASYKFWHDRIEESYTYKGRFPRIQFIFLARPYVTDNWDVKENQRHFYHLPYSGDVTPEELCDAYFNHYNVFVGENYRVRNFLKTPLSVKLFCEIYKNSSIEGIDNNTIVISKLFHIRITKLVKDFENEADHKFAGEIIFNILCGLATLFVDSEELSLKDIKKGLSDYESDELNCSLAYLEKEGFIYSRQKQENEFSPIVRMYSWGLQPALDFLIAQKVYAALCNNTPVTAKYPPGIYQMLGLIILEEKGKLLSDYPCLEIEADDMFELICYVMSNASKNATANYREYMLKIMKKSPCIFHEVVNEVILSVCRIEGHPLGATLLDVCLRDFDSPAERDIWWSIPAYIKNISNATWMCNTEFRLDEIYLDNVSVRRLGPFSVRLNGPILDQLKRPIHQ